MTISSKSLIMVLPLSLMLFSPFALAEDNDKKEDKKELGESSYNVSDCEAANEEDSENEKEIEDSGVEQKDLDECKPLVK